jgi:SAM-dependent methyltransferase
VRPLSESAHGDDAGGFNYGQSWPPSYPAFGRLRALLALSEARRLKPKRVLEVAAGDGALCACLAEDGCEVVANDLRRESLEDSIRHFRNREAIGIRPGNLFDLRPEDTGLFDLVIACEIIEHVAHSDDFLLQLKKFSCPGGRILLTTPNGALSWNPLPTWSQISDFNALEKEQFKPDADGHLFLITPAEMCLLAAKVGVAVERVDLWGTPFITGHRGLRHFSQKRASRLCFGLERLCQRLPYETRQKLCTQLSVVLLNPLVTP